MDGAPAIDPNLCWVYIGSNDGTVYALDDGVSAIWTFKTNNGMGMPAIGPDGTIYAGTTAPNSSTNDTVYAVSPTGKKKWGFRATDQLDSSAVIGYDGTIYIGGQGSDFIALTQAGNMKWIIGGISNFITINSTPAIGEDGTIYFGADDGYVYAIH